MNDYLDQKSLPDVRSISNGRLSISEKRMWYVVKPTDSQKVLLEDQRQARRKFVDDFIDATKNPLHPDNAEEGKEVIEYEKSVFKVHLKLPLRFKFRLLAIIANAMNEGYDKLFPLFKMYKDTDEADEDRKYPDSTIGSFVFYFGENPDETRFSTILKMKIFLRTMAKILKNSGIYEEMANEEVLTPRYSYQPKFKSGEAIKCMTITQGDADFKNRNLFQDRETLLDPDVNFAFFREDSDILQMDFDNIPPLPE